MSDDLPDIERIKKILDSVNASMKSFSTIDTVHEDIKRAFKIIVETSQTPPICSYFSSPDIHNLSSTYEYANKPPVYNCSYLEKSQPVNSDFKFCFFPSRQTSCMMYNPDIKVIASTKVSNFSSDTFELIVYLIRYRSYSGSYLYKIYDTNDNVYYDLDYQSEKADDQLDQEAIQIYVDFMTFSFPNFQFQDICFQQIVDTKKSFLKNLVFSEVSL